MPPEDSLYSIDVVLRNAACHIPVVPSGSGFAVSARLWDFPSLDLEVRADGAQYISQGGKSWTFQMAAQDFAGNMPASLSFEASTLTSRCLLAAGVLHIGADVRENMSRLVLHSPLSHTAAAVPMLDIFANKVYTLYVDVTMRCLGGVAAEPPPPPPPLEATSHQDPMGTALHSFVEIPMSLSVEEKRWIASGADTTHSAPDTAVPHPRKRKVGKAKRPKKSALNTEPSKPANKGVAHNAQSDGGAGEFSVKGFCGDLRRIQEVSGGLLRSVGGGGASSPSPPQLTTPQHAAVLHLAPLLQKLLGTLDGVARLFETSSPPPPPPTLPPPAPPIAQKEPQRENDDANGKDREKTDVKGAPETPIVPLAVLGMDPQSPGAASVPILSPSSSTYSYSSDSAASPAALHTHYHHRGGQHSAQNSSASNSPAASPANAAQVKLLKALHDSMTVVHGSVASAFSQKGLSEGDILTQGAFKAALLGMGLGGAGSLPDVVVVEAVSSFLRHKVARVVHSDVGIVTVPAGSGRAAQSFRYELPRKEGRPPTEATPGIKILGEVPSSRGKPWLNSDVINGVYRTFEGASSGRVDMVHILSVFARFSAGRNGYHHSVAETAARRGSSTLLRLGSTANINAAHSDACKELEAKLAQHKADPLAKATVVAGVAKYLVAGAPLESRFRGRVGFTAFKAEVAALGLKGATLCSVFDHLLSTEEEDADGGISSAALIAALQWLGRVVRTVRSVDAVRAAFTSSTAPRSVQWSPYLAGRCGAKGIVVERSVDGALRIEFLDVSAQGGGGGGGGGGGPRHSWWPPSVVELCTEGEAGG